MSLKKVVFLFLIIFSTTNNFSQKHVKCLPFYINENIHIVDDSQKTIDSTNYKTLKIIGDYQYALLDEKVCYNLNNCAKVKLNNLKTDDDYLLIENDLYFYNAKKKCLKNPFSEKNIFLDKSYNFLNNLTLENPEKSEEAFDIIEAIYNGKKYFLSNSKQPRLLLKEGFDIIKTEYVYSKQEELIGLIVYNKNYVICYNYNFSETFKLTELDFTNSVENDFIVFNKNAMEKFVKFYGNSVYAPTEMYFGIRVGAAGCNNNYKKEFRKKEVSKEIVIEIGNGLILKSRRYSKYFEIENTATEFNGLYMFQNELMQAEFIDDSNNKLNIFVNDDRINPKIIMAPKKILSQFKIIKPN